MNWLPYSLVPSLVLGYCLALVSNSKPSSRFTLPITKRQSTTLGKRQKSAAIGLGDFQDLRYSVDVTVGSTLVPVILDTGSADLWSIDTDCNISCGSIDHTPLISTSSLKPSGVSFEIDYGDLLHRTSASGMIYSGSVGIAGLQINDQFVAAVNSTDMRLSDTDISGILGIGFPLSSEIIIELLKATLDKQAGSIGVADAFIAAIPTQGPLLTRLALSGQLAAPMFTITLQREEVEIGGNIGQITIGQLPDGVSNESLTWVPVRLYTETQGGIPGPSDSPQEIYPIYWEIPIDDVLLNGQKLSKPKLQDGVGYTAMIDSGTSFLAGPTDVVNSIYSSVSGSAPEDPNLFYLCKTPVDMAFVIGGKTFPIDPRDFTGGQEFTFDCEFTSLSATDDPSTGFLMSWILGDPFMKSNLVAFYFGNVTHPSVDPPRIGFLSTVPNNANDLYGAAVSSAVSVGGFVFTSVPVPTGTLPAATTNSVGVPQASSVSASPSPSTTPGRGTSGGGPTGGSGSGSGASSDGVSDGVTASWLLISAMVLGILVCGHQF